MQLSVEKGLFKMFRIYDEIAAIKAGKQIQSVACPVCGTTLKMVIFGYPTEETEEFVNKHHKYFTLGGCICYGDDRDPVYLCEECYAEFTHDLKQIRLRERFKFCVNSKSDIRSMK